MAKAPLPLNALRAFEAVSRHLSFRKAADELHVTPAAVSHAVKGLEEQIGAALFERTTRSISLTATAERALPAVRAGFDQLHDAMTSLRRKRDDNRLTISVSGSFAYRWLLPRLERFRQAHPRYDVRIDATNAFADFYRGEIDVGLRFGRGRYGDDIVSECLMEDRAFPVCSPSLLEQGPPLNEPGDVGNYKLLHVNWTMEPGEEPSWRKWLDFAGADTDVETERGVTFTMDDMAILTAIDGMGLAIAMTAFVADDLAAGRLVKPFDDRFEMPVSFKHYLVYPKSSRAHPKIKAFRNWVLDEVSRMPATI